MGDYNVYGINSFFNLSTMASQKMTMTLLSISSPKLTNFQCSLLFQFAANLQ